MSRPRLLPSLNYRSKGIVDMSIPNEVLRGYDLIEVAAASNLNDAQNNPVSIFTATINQTFLSPTPARLRRVVDESNRDLTRFIFSFDDYATPFVANTPRVPNDSEQGYIRIRARLHGTNNFTDYGPIVAVHPFDFMSTGNPVFTATANAPDLGVAGQVPDTLSTGCMNIHLPYYSQTLSVTNLTSAGGSPLYLTFHAGMNPSILRPGETFVLTGAGAPEIFAAGDGDTPLFTIRTAVVNRG